MTKAENYGEALFLLAEENGICETVRDELNILMQIIAENPEYTRLLDTPAIKKAERLQIADEAFSSFSEYLKNLIKILTEARCAHLLPDVERSFAERYNDTRGILSAEIVTAVELNGAQIAAITEKLSKKTGKKILLCAKVDPTILGGVVLRYSDTQLDGSVKTRLDKFEEALSDIII